MLLQAEESYCDGNVEDAKKLYDDARSSARRQKFINEEALAYELAEGFILKLEMKERHGTYLVKPTRSTKSGVLLVRQLIFLQTSTIGLVRHNRQSIILEYKLLGIYYLIYANTNHPTFYRLLFLLEMVCQMSKR